MIKQAKEIVVGDVINVNTGYRPLDDENVKVLSITEGKDLFGNEILTFLIDSWEGTHDFDVDPDSNITMNTKIGEYFDKNGHKHWI